MAPSKANPARGQAAGLRLDCSSRNTPRFSTAKRPLQAPRYNSRYCRQLEAIHRLSPYALSCLLEAIASGADLQATVAQYAELDGDFIATYGGNRFPPAVHIIDGSGR